MFEVEIHVVTDIDDHAENGAVAELVRCVVELTHAILTVEADADAVSAQREEAGLRLPRRFGDDVVVDKQLGFSDRLAVPPRANAMPRTCFPGADSSETSTCSGLMPRKLYT